MRGVGAHLPRRTAKSVALWNAFSLKETLSLGTFVSKGKKNLLQLGLARRGPGRGGAAMPNKTTGAATGAATPAPGATALACERAR